LQHLDPVEQVRAKHNTLVQNFLRIGEVEPEAWWDAITGPVWGYRRKARLSVRDVPAKGRVLVGFRERYGRYVADMTECHVLAPQVGSHLEAMSDLIGSMAALREIPQIEIACGDNGTALVFRHMNPLIDADRQALVEFARVTGLAVLLQSGGPETIEPLEPEHFQLEYEIPRFELTLEFGPVDFIQVNREINLKMIDRAIELLNPGKSDRVLDLFCGLGNFTLALARLAGQVVGIEGDAGLVRLAELNARKNGIDNAEFHSADLTEEPGRAAWLQEPYDMVLIDPPRSGAEFILPHVAASGAHRIVYVSCHPASLARDAGILVRDFGFTLKGAGVMDMFPHTGHVESIALFERRVES
jgi:23S rRNA (uracil1939-C5)-methyltransferase